MYEEASNSNLIMLLHTAIYPFIAALIVSFITGKLLRSSSFLGYLGGFIVGLSLIHSGLSFPPKQAMDYYSISVIIGILAFVSLYLSKSSTALKYGICALLIGTSFYFLLNPVLQHSGIHMSIIWSVACTISTLAYILLSHQTNNSNNTESKGFEKLEPHTPMIGLMIVAGSAAPVISIGGSLLIGQLLGAFAAASAGYLLVSLITSNRQAFSSAPAVIILAGLISQSHVLADIPLHVMILIAASCFVTPIVRNLTQKAIPTIISQAILSILISGFCLWLVWPESSLY
ncbi:hypothetical protein [Marinomonas posidonica]|uniref:Transmembrane protein n=1 Tax=Marinomonas posidonica (strain CECT 7376 / NCIMB 14433 / IVIA-Po-181) TaxID=491952 RepID=F6CRP8_MARPP|nr:hypothetical protein [Marinomonas posidonica]AEF53811.1 hypothetical protein Mar181_0756 [Marinomonas posidonica IVIA-Po-181]